MEDSAASPPPPPLMTWGQRAEAIARMTAALSAFALATALLYDFVFWSAVDSRILTYFVLGDHIQTAVTMFALTILFAAIYAVVLLGMVGGILLIHRLVRGNRRVMWFSATLILWLTIGAFLEFGLTWTFGSLSLPIYGGGAVGLALICAVGGYIISRTRIMPGPYGGLFVNATVHPLSAAAMWVILTCLVATLGVLKELRSSLVDVVVFEEQLDNKAPTQLTGHVVRLLDRGVVLHVGDGQLAFIPKERIRRIQHGPTS